MKNKVLIILFVVLSICMVNYNASAKVTAYLVNNESTGEYLEYPYETLISDYINSLLKKPSPLYDEYSKKSKGLIGFKDDIVGYVNYDYIMNEYLKILARGEGYKFKMDNLTENSSSENIFIPNKRITERILKENKVQNGKVTDNNENISETFEVADIY